MVWQLLIIIWKTKNDEIYLIIQGLSTNGLIGYLNIKIDREMIKPKNK